MIKRENKLKKNSYFSISFNLTRTTAAPSFAMTEGNDSQTIQTAEQLKAEISAFMEDGRLTAFEKKSLLAKTEAEAVAELIGEKLDAAEEILNSSEDMMLQNLPGGSAYAVKKYDLGDNCILRVELEDRAESGDNGMALMPLATSGSSEMWKEYGNRYFTATAATEAYMSVNRK